MDEQIKLLFVRWIYIATKVITTHSGKIYAHHGPRGFALRSFVVPKKSIGVYMIRRNR